MSAVMIIDRKKHRYVVLIINQTVEILQVLYLLLWSYGDFEIQWLAQKGFDKQNLLLYITFHYLTLG
jgi:hypothetical protein